jgi:DNA-binding IclR family transcriptional regulator
MTREKVVKVEELMYEANTGGVQAVETGIRLLLALIALGPTSKLKILAEQSGMSAPKAHRYLTSYCRSGLVERDNNGGGYRLGPLALQMGLAVLRHLDVVKVTSPILTELRDETGFTTALAVWGSFGPTFVRLEESNELVVTTTRPGTVLPILSSSTGKIFGAFLPRKITASLLAAEMKRRGGLNGTYELLKDRELIKTMFERIKREGIAYNDSQEYHRGINAVAAPIFDHSGNLAAAITIWGEVGVLDTRHNGPIAKLLKEKTKDASRKMGML